jgi:hypothetical protein
VFFLHALRVGVWAFDKGVGHWRMPDLPKTKNAPSPSLGSLDQSNLAHVESWGALC